MIFAEHHGQAVGSILHATYQTNETSSTVSGMKSVCQRSVVDAVSNNP